MNDEAEKTGAEKAAGDQTGKPKDQIKLTLVSGEMKVWRLDKKKKKEARRTRELKTIQCAENRLTKSGRILAKALEKGFRTYRDERKDSAEKRKDGALVDFVDNFAKGFKKGQKRAAPASEKIITAFSTKRTKKQFRRVARRLTSLVPFLR
jgi:hypothetical protein